VDVAVAVGLGQQGEGVLGVRGEAAVVVGQAGNLLGVGKGRRGVSESARVCVRGRESECCACACGRKGEGVLRVRGEAAVVVGQAGNLLWFEGAAKGDVGV
jgi:hypothetical protein